jgi:hypothetical protein
MAILVVAEFEGGDQEFYEQVSGKALPGGQLPQGHKSTSPVPSRADGV